MSHHTTERRPSICRAPGGDGRPAFLLDVAVTHSSHGSPLMVIGIYVPHQKQSHSLVRLAVVIHAEGLRSHQNAAASDGKYWITETGTGSSENKGGSVTEWFFPPPHSVWYMQNINILSLFLYFANILFVFTIFHLPFLTHQSWHGYCVGKLHKRTIMLHSLRLLNVL